MARKSLARGLSAGPRCRCRPLSVTVDQVVAILISIFLRDRPELVEMSYLSLDALNQRLVVTSQDCQLNCFLVYAYIHKVAFELEPNSLGSYKSICISDDCGCSAAQDAKEETSYGEPSSRQ